MDEKEIKIMLEGSLLRALIWIDYVPDSKLEDEDMEAATYILDMLTHNMSKNIVK